jgi:hypothetical protein
MTRAKANAARGEHEIELAGRKYRLRPSHEAIEAIEQATGHALLALVRLANGSELKVRELGIIGAELIRAGAEDELTKSVASEKIGEMIYEQGVIGATMRFLLCLSDAASGGRTASGEAKPVAGPKGSTTGG